MEPEKLKYNIRDFAVATCEKKERLLTSVPLDTLMDTFSHNKKHKILVSLFLSFAKIQKKFELCK